VNPNSAARSSASGGLNIIATAQIPRFTTAQQPTHATDLNTELEALQALPADTTYDLVNATSQHRDNHFGTPNVVTALQTIADDYFNAFHRVQDQITHRPTKYAITL
jgi:hypothetical protein